MSSSRRHLLFVVFIVIGTVGEKLSQIENEQMHQICATYKKKNAMQSKILNGKEVESSEAPWAVAVLVFSADGIMHCSGTLVSSRHVITARHCFVVNSGKNGYTYVHNNDEIDYSNCDENDYVVPPKKIDAEVHFATRCRSEEVCKEINSNLSIVTRKVSALFLPYLCTLKGPNEYFDQDDIAIVELAEDVLFSQKIHPICVADSMAGIRRDDNVTIYGFGFDPADERISSGILKYEKSYIALCSFVSEKYVCAISFTGRQLACKGDSGGGVVFEARNGVITLVAIVSRGEACRFDSKFKGDILTPVFMYMREICKYSGICNIETVKTSLNVSKYFGDEDTRPNTKLGSRRKLILFLAFNIYFFALPR